ncbi:hypothetical protein [Pseudomonas sp. PDM25]|uniref:hypothetical protein n=1 Tax=Pseudomonas sp. PDM25 TaxID=2854772 RepID=UPI001C445987|nr:hypothetical protein [Pseudomonas sp. PDM25]MBV7515891.1 hypothetical protein [Pseudomonas sp. PDM25]
MSAYCLICDSKAVLSKEAAHMAVMLIGTMESILVGMSHTRAKEPAINPPTRPESHLLHLLELMGQGLSEARSECSAMNAFANDVQQYQFGPYDFFCCRCGARFDKDASTAPHNV